MTNIEAAKTLVLIARRGEWLPSGTEEAIAWRTANNTAGREY